MIQEIFQEVGNNWHLLGNSFPIPKQYSFLIQSRNRVIILLTNFHIQDYPFCVIKLERDKSKYELVKKHVDQSQYLRSKLSEPLKKTIPIAVVRWTKSEELIIIEQGLPGETIAVSEFDRGRVDRIILSCRSFCEWLVTFQDETQENENCLILQECLYKDRLSQLLNSQVLIEKAKKLLLMLEGIKISIGWRYGDIHPTNVLMNKGKISGIIDWEGISPQEPFFCDWFQFTLSLGLQLKKVRDPESSDLDRAKFATNLLFLDHSPLGITLQELTRDLFLRKGIDQEYIIPCYFLFLLKYYWFEPIRDLVSYYADHWSNHSVNNTFVK